MTQRSDLDPTQKRIVDAMLWLESARVPMPWHRTLLATTSECWPRSGNFKAAMAILRELELVFDHEKGGLCTTDAARRLATFPVGPFRRQWLHESILHRLERTQRRILQPLLEAYPEPIDRALIHERLEDCDIPGYVQVNALVHLRAAGLVDFVDRDQVRASENIMPEPKMAIPQPPPGATFPSVPTERPDGD